MTETVIIKNSIVPNLDGGTDLYIRDNTLNYSILFLKLESINRPDPKINKLFGKEYFVNIHEGIIYSGTISNKPLLPKPVPFGIVLKDSVSIVVKDVELTDDDIVMLTVKYDYDITYIGAHTMKKIQWPYGPENTFLIFSSGLAGIDKTIFEPNYNYFNKYGKELSTKVYHINHLVGNKLNKDYKSYLQEYFLGNILVSLATYGYRIIMETYIQEFCSTNDKVYGRIYSPGDSLTGIELLTNGVSDACIVHINDLKDSEITRVSLKDTGKHLLVQGPVYFECNSSSQKVTLKITRSVFNLNERRYSKDILKKGTILLTENQICNMDQI